jgi:exosortase
MATTEAAELDLPITADLEEKQRPSPRDDAGVEKAEAGAKVKTPFLPPTGVIVTAIVLLLLWVSIGGGLLHAWKSDKALSHGPLVPFIAIGLLYLRRDELKKWDSAAPLGLVGLLGSMVLFVLAVFADVEFMKPMSLIFALLSGFLFLGGKDALKTAIGPLGFLVFMIPWPTSLTERLAFPMQLASTTYGAIICGLIGMPIEREGVHLAVMNGATPPAPVYQVVVAQQCSGLTSLTVLLALGYLISYFTPIKLGWRALLMALIVPLTLLCNAVRLSAILIFGANVSVKAAKWVHDNEGPVLIFFCSILLMGLRAWLMKWLESRDKDAEPEPA